MPTQTERAIEFRALHQVGDPLILYNIWDAGSAKTVAASGAKALATGSAPVAMAFGYTDGENIPLDLVLETCPSVWIWKAVTAQSRASSQRQSHAPSRPASSDLILKTRSSGRRTQSR